ncbi:hypothetical protein K2173_019447 [Erythroxylum novogranatense]|uniref:C2H2-type domain-containing protein n=1 Tax=Erythroxylum novogranatense TaxID=1862640 RepID=A0AAV8UEM4_9ROSI|nr:hypothetical protein K2173_019447 [Erythroxylum novogranatense]
MEINNNRVRSKSELDWSLDDWQSSSSNQAQKSYTCAFCKRGFSNAQALGGHMNIHRRDRAKLREASDENLLSLDITRSTNPLDVSEVFKEKSSGLAESRGEKSPILRELEVSLSVEDDETTRNKGSEEFQQLPLFLEVEKTDANEEKKHSGQDSSQAELDLELRLGPEPSTSTREFF